MARIIPDRVKMPEQAPDIRNKNFAEVSTGYTEEMAKLEASRCMTCKKKPCVSGCPVGVPIPDFIAEVAKGDFAKAAEIILSTNALPAVCGRVCPQENQCEGKCARGKKSEPVAIGRLERFVADWNRENGAVKSAKPKENGIKAAIVGGGPAGLTCAGELAKAGYDVTIFEAFHKAGGVLVYGIPEFRLPKDIVQAEINNLTALGVKIKTDIIIGKTLSIDELFEMGYKSIFIGSGAGLPKFMNIPGENLLGVYSANEYLTRINLMKAYKDSYDTPINGGKRVVVVGGGNVAMDAARCAKRMGAEVYIVYRRGEAELPARREEVHHAKEEGVIFRLLNNPVEILSDERGYVRAVRAIKMELGEPDASGRRSPIEVAGSEFEIECDTVIMSLGTSPNPLLRESSEGIEFNRHGGIVVEEASMATTHPGIYAGGDAVSGSATVILAMGAGKAAAKAMDEYMKSL